VKFSNKTPALLLKIMLLGALNAFTVWSVPILISNKTWLFAIYFVISTLVLDFIFLTKKRVAPKYIVPGVVLLLMFQVYPAFFTGYVAFTNYSNGHFLDKETAIDVMVSNSFAPVGDTTNYMQVVRDNTTKKIALVIQDANGYGVGTREGYTAVPSSDLKLSGDGKIESVTGYTTLTEDEVFNILDEFNDYKVPIGNDKFYSVSDINAVELVAQNLSYNPKTDKVTDTVTGTVYSPNDSGSMVSEAGEEIEPGWTTTVGWRNFSKVINDERYRQPLLQVLAWTFIYAGLVVLSTFFLGLLLALVLNHPRMKSRKIYRTLLIVPYAMPSVLSTLVWAGMFNVDNGVINKLLGSPIPWLSDPWLAKFAVLLVQLWAGTPYMFLIATGAIQSLSTETIEAAQVDGASPFQVFSKIKLPLVLMTLAPLLIASYAYNFSNFGAIYLLTGGGPTIISSGGIAGHTDILISYTYKIAFAAGKGNDYGLASAVSFFNFLLVSSMSIYSFKKSKTIENMT
jgi:arabinogalactan oligomer/maltooligosaccharide transport system permease protein